MLNIFKRRSHITNSDIKVSPRKSGSHGDHWGAVLGFGFDEQALLKMIGQTFKNKPVWQDKKISTCETPHGFFDLHVLREKKKFRSAFPILHENAEYPFKTEAILSWEHAGNHEAQIAGSEFENGFGLNFFAVDYAKNKEIYHSERVLKIAFSAFAYVVDIEKLDNKKFSKGFTGYMYYDHDKYRDEYDFIGEIKNIKRANFGNEKGFIIDIKIAGGKKCDLVIPTFANKKNIKCPDLKRGMKISGVLWLQGSIAEEKGESKKSVGN